MYKRPSSSLYLVFFFFNDTATTEIYTLSLHDALPIRSASGSSTGWWSRARRWPPRSRSEEHTSELQSQFHLVCRLLLEKKKKFLQSLQISYKRDNNYRTNKRKRFL